MTSIKNHLITFEEFLKLGGNLQKTGAGYRANFQASNALCSCELSTEAIAKVDMRLPKVIDAMFEEEGKFRTDKSMSRVYVQTIQSTLNHWDYPVQVKTIHNHSVYINKITKVLQYPTPRGDVALSVECSRHINHIDGIPYVTTTVVNDIEVPLEELDRFYPGWQTRYDVLSQLGYVNPDLVDQVFQKPQSVSPIPMGNVSFD